MTGKSNLHNGSGKKHRVLLIDDHPLVRCGLAEVISREPDLEVCGEAGDVAEALGEVDRSQPDIAVIDLTLKTGHGIELLERLKTRAPALKTLVSSMHDETLFAERVLRAGAKGYVTKHEPPEVLIRAIRQVLRGELFLSPAHDQPAVEPRRRRISHAGGSGAGTVEPRSRGLRDDRPGLDDPADRRPAAPQSEDDRNPPREDQAEA